MVFEDDFIQVNWAGGVKRYRCKANNIPWPPPERIEFLGWEIVRKRYSTITDEQRATMTQVCRGAEYEPVDEVNEAA